MSHATTQLLPQTLRLCGSRYEFIVEATPTQDECWFEIRATHRASERSSVINTLTTLMSELLTDDQDATDERWEDTPWGVSPGECARPVQTTVKVLTDAQALARIENALDEDRAEGDEASIMRHTAPRPRRPIATRKLAKGRRKI